MPWGERVIEEAKLRGKAASAMTAPSPFASPRNQVALISSYVLDTAYRFVARVWLEIVDGPPAGISR